MSEGIEAALVAPLVLQDVGTCGQQWPEGYCLSLVLHQDKVLVHFFLIFKNFLTVRLKYMRQHDF